LQRRTARGNAARNRAARKVQSFERELVMGISGVGGVGAAGAGGGIAPAGIAAGTSGAAAASGASSATNAGVAPNALDSLPPNMQSLVDTLKDFSSAEILIALMLAAAAGKDDDEKGGTAAGAFLAGLALAGQLGQSTQIDLNLEIPQFDTAGGAGAGGAGLSLNVTV